MNNIMSEEICVIMGMDDSLSYSEILDEKLGLMMEEDVIVDAYKEDLLQFISLDYISKVEREVDLTEWGYDDIEKNTVIGNYLLSKNKNFNDVVVFIPLPTDYKFQIVERNITVIKNINNSIKYFWEKVEKGRKLIELIEKYKKERWNDKVLEKIAELKALYPASETSPCFKKYIGEISLMDDSVYPGCYDDYKLIQQIRNTETAIEGLTKRKEYQINLLTKMIADRGGKVLSLGKYGYVEVKEDMSLEIKNFVYSEVAAQLTRTGLAIIPLDYFDETIMPDVRKYLDEYECDRKDDPRKK